MVHYWKFKRKYISSLYNFIPELNNKVSLVQANIVNLKVDGIVNAAQKSLLGGKGIDGCIHKAAGPELKNKCKKLPISSSGIRCDTGQCKVTDTTGCNLNCEYVFHTVGPDVSDTNLSEEHKQQLKDCYENCLSNIPVLQYQKKHVQTIAFPCISTGIYNFDNREAAKIAIETVRLWLEIITASLKTLSFAHGRIAISLFTKS